jgi:hypothetical protein
MDKNMKKVFFLFVLIISSFITLFSQNNTILEKIDENSKNFVIPSLIYFRDVVLKLYSHKNESILIETTLPELEKAADSLLKEELGDIYADRSEKWRNCVTHIKKEMNKFKETIRNKEKDKYSEYIDAFYKDFFSLSLVIKNSKKKSETFHNIIYYIGKYCTENKNRKELIDLIPEIKSRRDLILEWHFVNITQKFIDLSDLEIEDRKLRYENGITNLSKEIDKLIEIIPDGNMNEIKERIGRIHILYHENEDIVIQDFVFNN